MNKTTASITTLLAIVALVFSFIAYNRSGKNLPTGNLSQGQDTLTRVLSTKVIKVCYAVWPPAVIKDATTGKLSGHDIDAMELMAKSIGATVEYHETTFGNMIAGVQSGQCDIGTSLFNNIPRAAATAFSRPVLYAGISGLARKGDTRFKTAEDMDKAGINVATATGEAGDIYAKGHFKNAKVTSIDVESSDLSRFLLEVTSGRADIGIADAQTIRLFAATHPDTVDAFANNPFNLSPDAYPMRLGDASFISFVDNALLDMQISGQWDEFEKKYDAHWLHEVKQYQTK